MIPTKVIKCALVLDMPLPSPSPEAPIELHVPIAK